MSSFFSLNKKTSSILLIGLSLISLPLIQSKEKSNLRILDSDSDKACWIESYGRGVGKPITVCPDGLEESGLLCYPPCKEGYTGVGPVCWQNCPSGFKDTSADCLKPGSYGRGSGYASWHQSECEQDNSQGCEEYGWLYYPKCQEGFEPYGCCVCSPKCPNGMTDIGVSCQKQSYGRGAGKPLVCKADQQEDAGLCYPPCRKGYDGIGPVCWGTCPANMSYQCGALCVENAAACANDVYKITEAVFKFFVQLAETGEDGDFFDLAKSGLNLSSQFTQYSICSNM